jgi:hypothetical protein
LNAYSDQYLLDGSSLISYEIGTAEQVTIAGLSQSVGRSWPLLMKQNEMAFQLVLDLHARVEALEKERTLLLTSSSSTHQQQQQQQQQGSIGGGENGTRSNAATYDNTSTSSYDVNDTRKRKVPPNHVPSSHLHTS